jgi:hypothetical protein
MYYDCNLARLILNTQLLTDVRPLLVKNQFSDKTGPRLSIIESHFPTQVGISFAEIPLNLAYRCVNPHPTGHISSSIKSGAAFSNQIYFLIHSIIRMSENLLQAAVQPLSKA